MLISEPDKAEHCLHRVGYYRLSAYWYPFRQFGPKPDERQDVFLEGTSFDTIFDLYVFDKRLRLLFLDALERIEIALRTDIALILGRHDPWSYRKARFLDGKFVQGRRGPSHGDWLGRFDEQANRSKEEFAVHFRRKYPDDPLPIWIAVELMDFGTLSILYSGMRTPDRRDLASRYGIERPEIAESWIRTLNFIRNVCAHHARLWNTPLKEYPRMPKAGELPAFDHLLERGEARGRLYAAVCIARHFLGVINPTTSWPDRLAALMTELPEDPHVKLSAAGFPDNWRAHVIPA